MLQKLKTLQSWRAVLGDSRSLLAAIRLHYAGRGRPPGDAAAAPALRVRGNPLALHCRPGTSDFVTFLEVFVVGEYAAARQTVGPPVRWVVDLGTNVGFSVAYFAALWPEAAFVGVEPDDGNLAAARRTLAPLLDAGRAHLHRNFIGARPRQARVARAGVGPNEYRLAESAGGSVGASTGDEVEVVTVAHLLDRHDIATVDLLKCDIEGGERELFSDCRAWIGRVRHVVAELHDGLDDDWLLARLAENGGAFARRQVERRHDGAMLVWLAAAHA